MNIKILGLLIVFGFIFGCHKTYIDEPPAAPTGLYSVTGDNKVTALAIAKECGIITEVHPDCVMEGPEFYKRVGGLKCKN